MTKRYVLGQLAAGVIACAVAATPARAQDDEPPPHDPQQEPQVEYQDVCPPPAAPPTCPPCQPQPTSATSPADPHHGLLLLGYVGVNAFPGKGALSSQVTGISMGVDPGLRLGGLVGYYATPRFSVNGELAVDIINSDDPYGYWTTGGTRAALSLSPLFHLPASASSAVEVVLGPRLGLRWMKLSSQSAESFSSRGTLFGLNAGVFVHGGAVMLGGLISFDAATAGEACRAPSGGVEYCYANASDIATEKVVSLSGSVLY